MITQDILKEWLHYDPNTGDFTWLKRYAKGSHIKIGSIAGTVPVQNKQYIIINILNQRYYAHRLAWLFVHGEFPKNNIDHINRNKSDNRISNLREATQSENNFNVALKSNNTSGFKGVTFHNIGKKWRSEPSINGKRYYLGLFNTKEEAAAAYQDFVKKHHGEFYLDTAIGAS